MQKHKYLFFSILVLLSQGVAHSQSIIYLGFGLPIVGTPSIIFGGGEQFNSNIELQLNSSNLINFSLRLDDSIFSTTLRADMYSLREGNSLNFSTLVNLSFFNEVLGITISTGPSIQWEFSRYSRTYDPNTPSWGTYDSYYRIFLASRINFYYNLNKSNKIGLEIFNTDLLGYDISNAYLTTNQILNLNLSMFYALSLKNN